MAITFDGHQKTDGSGGGFIFPISIGSFSNRYLLICFQLHDTVAGDRNVTSLTYNGVACTKLFDIEPGNDFTFECWGIVEGDLPAAGTYDLDIGLGGVTSLQVTVVKLHGDNPIVPGATASDIYTNTSGETLVLTSQKDDPFIVAMATAKTQNADIVPVTSGLTEITEKFVSATMDAEVARLAASGPAGNFNIQYNFTSTRDVAAIQAIELTELIVHEMTGTTQVTGDGSVVLNVEHQMEGAAQISGGGSTVLNVEYQMEGTTQITGSGSADLTIGNFSFNWSIDNLEARTDYGFPTVYVDIDNNIMPTGAFPTGEFYERRFLQMPRLEESELDTRFGITGFQKVTLTVDNADSLFGSIGSNLQGAFLRIFFVDASGNVYKEFKGQVVDWTLSHQTTINVEDVDSLALSQDLPKRTINDLVDAEKTAAAGFAANVVANDLGKPIPIIFGRAVKVPLLYVKADEASREYDYIIGEGAGLNSKFFQEVFTVYRDEKALDSIEGDVSAATSNTLTLETADKRQDSWYRFWWVEITAGTGAGQIRDVTAYVSSTNRITVSSNWTTTPDATSDYRLREWRFYDGSQASPYDDYAFIRFKKRMGERGRTDPLYADVNGLEDEVNVVDAIESVLSSSNWGFGLTVDSTSFATASALSEITAMKCEGALLNTTSASDLLRELLGFRDMVLSKADNIEIAVDQSKTSSLNIGLGDETGRHNILDASPAIEYIHPSDKVKNLKVRYRKNHRESDAYLHEIERSSSTNGVDTNISMPFVYEHVTADRILDYKRKRFAAADRRLGISVGQDAIATVRGELVTLDIPSLSVSSDWEVTSTDVTPAGEQGFTLVPYSALPYTYVSFTSEGGTLPVDESFDITPDFTQTNPDPVTNLSVSMLMDTTGLNLFPYAELTWDPPEDNYSGALVSVKLNSDPDTAYKSKGTFEDSARIDGLTPGQLYDFKVEALNITGELKSIAVEDTSNIAGGDNTAPNIPTGLTGDSHLQTLTWTWTPSTSNDVAYHEVEVYTVASGGSAVAKQKFLLDDDPLMVYVPTITDLTTSVTRYAQVRAVDHSGNASSFTSRVSATISSVVRDDLEDNATMNIETTVNNSARPGVNQSVGVWYTVLSDSITTDRTTIIKVRYNGQWEDTGDGFELRLRRNSSTLKTITDIRAVQHHPVTINDARSISSGTHTYEVQTRHTFAGGTGLGLENNSLSIQGDFK